MPSIFGTLIMQIQTYHSEVAAGRIARFTPTRLCCSQILSIQDLFSSPHMGKEKRHQRLHVGACAPSPALYLSGLSSPSFDRVTNLLPRITPIVAKIQAKSKQ